MKINSVIVIAGSLLSVAAYAEFDQRLVGSWDLGCYSDNTREVMRFKTNGDSSQESYVYENESCKGKLLEIKHFDGGRLTTSESTNESVIVNMPAWKDKWIFKSKYSAEVRTLRLNNGTYREIINESSPRMINRY